MAWWRGGHDQDGGASMITREDAEQTAARWARSETARTGVPATPMVHEFDLGFVIWTGRAPGAPGDGARTVIDRETGELAYFGALPLGAIERIYRDQRGREPELVSTVDRTAELRRQNQRRVTPTVAAHLTIAADGRMRRAVGAKSDVAPQHHPLVRDWLAAQPAHALVRGAERHAELIVVSQTLHDLDAVAVAQGRPRLTLDAARAVLSQRRLEVLHVRDAGDPLGGKNADACSTCVAGFVHFGVLPSEPRFLQAQQPYEPASRDDVGETAGLPADVARILVASGWLRPSPYVDDLRRQSAGESLRYVLDHQGRDYTHVDFPAAVEAVVTFGHIDCDRHTPGEAIRVVPFSLWPESAAATADALGDFGRLIGVRLFPLGTDLFGAVIAIDERGRVFLLDQAGEWFAGQTIQEALTHLVRGAALPRIRTDGAW